MKIKRSAWWRRRRGAELIEFTFVFVPILGFTFLLLNMGWVIYKRATLQFAVREGCRYAVTNQTSPGLGVADSIATEVQFRAMGFLGKTLADLKPSHPHNGDIVVRYYCSGQNVNCGTVDLTNALKNPTDCTDQTNGMASPPTGTPLPNQGGNLVEVSVENYQAYPLVPFFVDPTPFQFIARSSDRVEAKSLSGVPPLLTCTP